MEYGAMITSILHLSTDLFLELCDYLSHKDLIALSLVNRNLRYLLLPSLFRNTRICDPREPFNLGNRDRRPVSPSFNPMNGASWPTVQTSKPAKEGGWPTLQRASRCLIENRPLLQEVKRLKIWIASQSLYYRIESPGLSNLFVMLFRMHKLQDLHLRLFRPLHIAAHSHLRELAIMQGLPTQATFPAIKRLDIDIDALWIASCCPNLETLSLGLSHRPSGYTEIKARNNPLFNCTANLTFLDAPSEWIKLNAVSISIAFPRLRRLRAHGTRGR
ncbi:hypothetical protein P154DRAFT_70997 [Amniculicola lignicola CBS 123094]|uniref:F-box domain-containing protein n=1 Tax=Amniculicola lignicola CBS 123094 TaxID=1392246 RepID=A0A6A5VX72_9PLEO|nr:hypothetical protein P154DRAFT_70997 [Amniculicola lignicola CBS 123094]